MKKNLLCHLALCVLLFTTGCATPPPKSSTVAVARVHSDSVPPTAAPVTPFLLPGPTAPALIDDQLSIVVPASNKPVTLWERIRQGFAVPELSSPLVAEKEKFYAARPEYVQRMSSRAGRYLYFIVNETEARGMPTEIALLPFIESAFNPQALSTAKASGMWQFIPSTGKSFGLRQTVFEDERRDVIQSTRAALDYLTKLHHMFQDWHLALAAYNWGEGSVSRAIERNRRAGLPTDYASLKMPLETQQYVPKLLAIKNIVANPENFGLTLPDVDNQQYFTTLTKTRDIDVKTAARLAEMSLEDFRALNPSFNKPMIIGATQPQIVLPIEKADIFQRNLSTATGPLASFTAHRVNSKQSLDSIASQYGTSADHLRDINGIPRGMRLKVGATLLVPRPSHIQKDIPIAIAQDAVLALEPQVITRRINVKVRRGDTLPKLASKYGVTVNQIKTWNRLGNKALVPQTTLVLNVPVKDTQVASKKNTQKKTLRVARR